MRIIGLRNFSLAGIFKLRKTFGTVIRLRVTRENLFIMKKINILIILLTLFFSGIACHKLVLKEEFITNSSQWPQFGMNPNRTRATEKHFTFPLKLQWQHKAASAVGQSIVTANGMVFFSTKNGHIEGVNLDTGEKIGRIKKRGSFEATCAYSGDEILIVRRFGQPTLTLYDIETGKSTWKTRGTTVFSEPLIVKNRIYIGKLNGELSCYELKDGTEIWSQKLPAQIHASPTFADGLIIIGDDNGHMHAFDESSAKSWEFETKSAIYTSPVLSEGILYFGSTDGVFYAIDAKTGTQKWSFKSNNKLYNGAAVSGDYVIFGSTDHQVYCFHKNTGKNLWTFKAKSVISTAPVIAGPTVFIGSLDKNIYALDLETGEKRWSFESQGRIRTDPIVSNGKLLFASEDNKLYCFEEE